MAGGFSGTAPEGRLSVGEEQRVVANTTAMLTAILLALTTTGAPLVSCPSICAEVENLRRLPPIAARFSKRCLDGRSLVCAIVISGANCNLAHCLVFPQGGDRNLKRNSNMPVATIVAYVIGFLPSFEKKLTPKIVRPESAVQLWLPDCVAPALSSQCASRVAESC